MQGIALKIFFFFFEGHFEKGAGRTICGTTSHEGLGQGWGSAVGESWRGKEENKLLCLFLHRALSMASVNMLLCRVKMPE